MDVPPTLAWHNGTFSRMVVGDTYDAVPVDLGSPMGDINDPRAKLFPFKVMAGDQPADTVNKVMGLPHLWGQAGGPTPYWGNWNWVAALAEGAAAAGVAFSGTFEFVETTLHMELHHEIAPASAARRCVDCHGAGALDWEALGYDGDPARRASSILHATELWTLHVSRFLRSLRVRPGGRFAPPGQQ